MRFPHYVYNIIPMASAVTHNIADTPLKPLTRARTHARTHARTQVDVGNHMSLVKLSSGKFVAIDALDLSKNTTLKDQLDQVGPTF